MSDPTAKIDSDVVQDLDVLFYAGANPKYVNGHGLITIAPMHFRNYLAILFKCTQKFFSGSKRKKKIQQALPQPSLSTIPQQVDPKLSLIHNQPQS